jgi:hypothetical protein
MVIQSIDCHEYEGKECSYGYAFADATNSFPYLGWTYGNEACGGSCINEDYCDNGGDGDGGGGGGDGDGDGC